MMATLPTHAGCVGFPRRTNRRVPISTPATIFMRQNFYSRTLVLRPSRGPRPRSAISFFGVIRTHTIFNRPEPTIAFSRTISGRQENTTRSISASPRAWMHLALPHWAGVASLFRLHQLGDIIGSIFFLSHLRLHRYRHLPLVLHYLFLFSLFSFYIYCEGTAHGLVRSGKAGFPLWATGFKHTILLPAVLQTNPQFACMVMARSQ